MRVLELMRRAIGPQDEEEEPEEDSDGSDGSDEDGIEGDGDDAAEHSGVGNVKYIVDGLRSAKDDDARPKASSHGRLRRACSLYVRRVTSSTHPTLHSQRQAR